MTHVWYPTGTQQVGVADMSAGAASPLEHFTARVYYPTDQRSGWSWPTRWIGQYKYALGFATYATLSMPLGLKRSFMRGVLSFVIYLIGATLRLRVRYNAIMAQRSDTDGQPGGHPVILFSHGIAGTRTTYSSICISLASQGYVVVALEHADGSASAALHADVPGKHAQTWRLYSGLGDKASQYQKTQHRVQELRTAERVLCQLNKGVEAARPLSVLLARQAVPAVHLSVVQPAHEFFKGQLDMSRVGLVGHSYGGATVALAASQFPEFGCAVALDPWWGALPLDSAALTGWQTRSPLLIIGSHDWNIVQPDGTLKCNGSMAMGPRQDVVLQAVGGPTACANGDRSKADGTTSCSGPGAVLLVPRGTTHGSFDDIALLFGDRYRFLVPMLGKPRADAETPLKYHELNVWSIDHFMRTSLGCWSKVSAAPDATSASKDSAAAVNAGCVALGLASTALAFPRPVVAEDKAAYLKQFGDLVATLRVVPGGKGASTAEM